MLYQQLRHLGTQSFYIQLASSADVFDLAHIYTQAFASDRHTQLKTHNNDKFLTESMEQGMRQAIFTWLATPATHPVLKAMDDVTGDVMGWICWSFHGFENPSESQHHSHWRRAIEGGEKSDMNIGNKSAVSEFPTTEQRTGKATEATKTIRGQSAQSGIQRLEQLTDADMERWKRTLMPQSTTKCMVIVATAVSPKYQFRGVGSALIDWGIVKADAAKVFSWVHASAGGYRIFANHHYQIVGQLEVDLDQYADGLLPKGDGKWGQYTFRYMKRPFEEFNMLSSSNLSSID